MNTKGQILLYDVLLAIILVVMVMLTITYVLEDNTQTTISIEKYEKPQQMLNLLENRHYLTEITQNQSQLDKIDQILGENYTLTDTTTDDVLIDEKPLKYRNIYGGHKIVNGHDFELRYFE